MRLIFYNFDILYFGNQRYERVWLCVFNLISYRVYVKFWIKKFE